MPFRPLLTLLLLTSTLHAQEVLKPIQITIDRKPTPHDILETSRLRPPLPGQPKDWFGWSVAISGPYAAVGAVGQKSDAASEQPQRPTGAVYVYEHADTGWRLQQSLQPIVGNYSSLGSKISMAGNWIAASAVGPAPGYQRCVYLFQRDPQHNTWRERQRLQLDSTHSDDSFGWSLSMSGHHLAVGAVFEGIADSGRGISNAGAVYIYEDTGGGWRLMQRLLAPHPRKSGFFGTVVSLAGNYALVGCNTETYHKSRSETFYESGAVFVYRLRANHRQPWKLQQTLNDPRPDHKSWFGTSVATDGSSVIIGARGQPDTADDGYMASGVRLGYIYTRRGHRWRLQQKLMTDHLMYHASPGNDMGIDGDKAIAGAYMDDDMRGSVYLLQRVKAQHWESNKKILHHARGKAMFGICTAISGDWAIAGAYQQDGDTGAAYVISLK